MVEDTDARLARLLGEVPDYLANASPRARDTVAELLEQARRAQDQRLQHALKHSLDFVPPFLRGPVRSLFLRK